MGDKQFFTTDHTIFQIGDTVRNAADGRVGTIVMPDNLIPTFVDDPNDPPPRVKLLPTPWPVIPSSTGGNPQTDRVKVQWADGTSSVVPLRQLGRV